MDFIYRYDHFSTIVIRLPYGGLAAIQSMLDGNRGLLDFIGRCHRGPRNGECVANVMPIGTSRRRFAILAGIVRGPPDVCLMWVRGCPRAAEICL